MRELILVAQRLQESMEISKGTRWFAKGSLMVLAIYLGSTSLIRYALAPPSVAKESAAPKKITQPPADEARFRASFEAGKQALSEGRYVSALDNFLEAERSADQLTDDQYDALKEARLQIAQVYESAGDNGAANNVYRTLADCANRKGDARFKAKSFEGALARARDAEQFSERLIEGKRDSLQASTSLLVSALNALHLYGQAVHAQQHWIDFLKTSADDYDQVFVPAYTGLAGIYGEAGDWHGVEAALTQAIDSCDTIHAHFTAANVAFIDPTFERSWSQYNLVIAYSREGNTDSALSKAQDFFTEYSQKEQDTTHALNVIYRSGDFAALALQIATEAKRQDDIDLWQKRAPGGVKIITLRPLATP
jgi:tetratricopeptide (TPR) repeat protein